MKEKAYTVSADQRRKIRESLATILRRDERISFAYLYGSFTDDSSPFHDIDLGVFFAGANLPQMSINALAMAADLTQKTTFPVDVRVLNHAPVSFLYHVFKGEKLCENDEDLRCKVMEHTIRHYLDIQPILRRAMKEVFSR
jgi:uncharacterized protein